jgi:uncharacterized membrane protein YgcG
MTHSSIKASMVAMSTVALLTACADPALPTYSYYSVPCPPGAIGATPEPATSADTSAPTPTPSVAASGAEGASPPTAANCITAVPNYGYAVQYPAYWDYGWPYYDGLGFAFVGRGFDRRFHDRDFDHGFHDHDFHGGFHDHGFHGGGSHAGGFHSGGFHGGGHGGRG